MKTLITKIFTLLTTYKQALSVLGLIVLLFLISLLSNFTYNFIKSPSQGLELSEEYSDTGYDDCNIMGIEMRGDIYTYVPLDSEGNKLEGYEDTTTSDQLLYLLDEAEYSDEILGTLIEVDSYGGSPGAAEEIANAIKTSQKPVVAFIRDAGTSAAYYAITPADKIFALKNSDVGSIGVTSSYVDNVSKNQQDGYSFVQLSAGKFKDSGSPDKPLTQEERNLFMRDIEILHENFIQTVSENRKISIEKVRTLADGSSVLGEKAKELGLIDEIGDYADAQAYLEELVGEMVNVCW
jgi:signal peptide peptidase SppA